MRTQWTSVHKNGKLHSQGPIRTPKYRVIFHFSHQSHLSLQSSSVPLLHFVNSGRFGKLQRWRSLWVCLHRGGRANKLSQLRNEFQDIETDRNREKQLQFLLFALWKINFKQLQLVIDDDRMVEKWFEKHGLRLNGADKGCKPALQAKNDAMMEQQHLVGISTPASRDIDHGLLLGQLVSKFIS